MMQHLTDLVKIINSGECYAFVGSGASCDMGVPSWKVLAERLHAFVCENCPEHDPKTYQEYLRDKRYPELFWLAEQDLGSYSKLIETIQPWFTAQRPTGEVYRYLARWPFACYLTTNFDDYLKEHLANVGVYYSTRLNTRTDLRSIRADTSELILKIHGDFTDPENMVLTSKQYEEFRTGPQREYFRRKLGEIFGMVPVLIVGYSLKDPDIDLIISQASHYASPTNPIYMIVSDITEHESNQLYATKNLRVFSYQTSDGQHTQLSRRILSMLDRFVAPRSPGAVAPELFADVDPALTCSLFIFTNTRLKDASEDFATDIYGSLVLATLETCADNKVSSYEDLASGFPFEFLRTDYEIGPLKTSVERLLSHALVAGDQEAGELVLIPKGVELVRQSYEEATLLKDQVVGQAKLDFKQEFPESSDSESEDFADTVQRAFELCFKSRGLSIAACIYGREKPVLYESLDIFQSLQQASNHFQTLELRSFFIQYVADQLVRPADPFKRYLAHLSQGYFAYHALGFDKKCTSFRKDLLSKTVWIVDSSIILPLVARESHNHRYAVDLFDRLQELGLRAFTTTRLFDEVVSHAKWAYERVREYGADTTDFMMIALLRGDYKQNLFIDGFVNSAADNPALEFDEYMSSVFYSEGTKASTLEEVVQQTLQAHGVQTISFSKWPGFKQIDWGERPYWTQQIKQDRQAKGTYRSDIQCEAEAEVLQILMMEREGKYGALQKGVPSKAYFISQSGVLRRVARNQEQDCPVWSPEAFYRYLLCFPTRIPWNGDSLQQCMTSDLFFSGIQVIDEARYTKYFKPQINEANLRFEDVVKKYESAERSYLEDFSRFFDEIPDLEKPFFSLQAAWAMAAREGVRAEMAQRTGKLSDKERRELKHLREDQRRREQLWKRKRRQLEAKKALGKKKKKRKKR